MTTLHADIRARFTAEGAERFVVDATIDVERGETLVVLGPSGSGKTLLLETIAGFHGHDGIITFEGENVSERPPERREFGFVFQDYALFPHMTVRENVKYGTRYHDETRDPDVLLEELGVSHLADRYPPTLSGGEKQRVALARSLAVQPSMLLLDEPLAALDVPTRQRLQNDLVDVLSDVTSVYVTHNRTEARAIGDRILVMHGGEVVQRGTPTEVFEQPASTMVAEFTGANTLDLSEAPSLRAQLNGEFTSGHVAIRPEEVSVSRSQGDIEATVERVVQEDGITRVGLSFDGVTIDAFTNDPPTVGEEVWITCPPEKIHQC